MLAVTIEREVSNCGTMRFDSQVEAMEASFSDIRLEPHTFHGDWNYTIRSTSQMATFGFSIWWAYRFEKIRKCG